MTARSEEIEFDLAQVLAESREFLVENGWARGDFRSIEDVWDEQMDVLIGTKVIGYCAVGGVLYSQGIQEHKCSSDPRVLAVADALIKAIDMEVTHRSEDCTIGNGCSCRISWITTWNDNLTDSDEQVVLDAYLKAEKDARSGNVDE